MVPAGHAARGRAQPTQPTQTAGSRRRHRADDGSRQHSSRSWTARGVIAMASKALPARTSPFRAISFDAGETLVRPYPSFAAAFAGICRQHGLRITRAQAAEIGAASTRRLIEYQRRGLTFSNSTESSREFWMGLYREFLAGLGVGGEMLATLPERLYDGFTRAERYRPFADARLALRAARKRGLVVGVLSNWEPWLVRLLGELKIDHLLDFVVVSGVCGYEKPDPRIYREALKAAGVSPGEMVHVGDSLHTDVAGARAVGITPVLLDRHRRHPDADCLRVASLRELTAPGGVLDGVLPTTGG